MVGNSSSDRGTVHLEMACRNARNVSIVPAYAVALSRYRRSCSDALRVRLMMGWELEGDLSDFQYKNSGRLGMRLHVAGPRREDYSTSFSRDGFGRSMWRDGVKPKPRSRDLTTVFCKLHIEVGKGNTRVGILGMRINMILCMLAQVDRIRDETDGDVSRGTIPWRLF